MSFDYNIAYQVVMNNNYQIRTWYCKVCDKRGNSNKRGDIVKWGGWRPGGRGALQGTPHETNPRGAPTHPLTEKNSWGGPRGGPFKKTTLGVTFFSTQIP